MSALLICFFAAFVLFVGVLVCLRAGSRLGRKYLAQGGDESHAGLGAVDGAIYGMMGLLIAFTFTGAASRFQQRRDLITQQVSAAGTAWLRADLLDGSAREQVRAQLRAYVDTLILFDRQAGSAEALAVAENRIKDLQRQIWPTLVVASRANPSVASAPALLAPFNTLFDLTQARFLFVRQHPPTAIYLLLGALVMVSAALVGFGMSKAKRQSGLHVIGFSLVVALAVYLIIDLEFPRLGLIRVDQADQALVDLRASME